MGRGEEVRQNHSGDTLPYHDLERRGDRRGGWGGERKLDRTIQETPSPIMVW